MAVPSDYSDQEIWETFCQEGNISKTAAALGCARSSIDDRLNKIKAAMTLTTPTHDIDLPPEEIDLEALVRERKRKFELKQAREESLKLIECRVKVPGPIGIVFHGDPHVDDDGTDILTMERFSGYTRTVEGCFAATVGDITNNWVGRLAKLYAEQSTSQAEALALGEWFVNMNNWLFLTGGNHDAWSGQTDAFKWICKQHGSFYHNAEVRMQLQFPKGDPVIINCRHDFSGHSMWNPVHGAIKAAQLGPMDDIFVNGHTHVSGYIPMVQPNGVISHCLQVSSYKVYDRYAKERGFREQTISPAVFVIIDPQAEVPTRRITVHLDVDEGVEYLRWLRSR